MAAEPSPTLRRSAAPRARLSHALAMLYFIRTGVSFAWITVLGLLDSTLPPGGPPGPRVWIWLVLYPLADAAATALDIRRTSHDARTIAQPINMAASLLAAAGLASAATRGFTGVVQAFGVWAIVSGLIQLFVAVRRNALVSAQWLMFLSGAGSVYAGVTFLAWHGSAHNGLNTLRQYSTGGAIWYLLAAIWLLAAAQRTTAATARVGSPPTVFDPRNLPATPCP